MINNYNKIIKPIFFLSIICIVASIVGYIVSRRLFESFYAGVFGMILVIFLKWKTRTK